MARLGLSVGGAGWWRLAAAVLLAGAVGAVTAAELELRVVDGQGRPLRDAVVFVESPEAAAAVRPAPPLEIAQADKRFVPTVTVLPVGSSVHFPNRDTVRHHVYSFSPVKRFEIKLYVGTPASPVVFDRPGIAVLGCNIHDQMVAWVVVVETPYVGQTGTDGRLLLELPAGSYTLRAWHPSQPPGAAASEQPLAMGPARQQAGVKLANARP